MSVANNHPTPEEFSIPEIRAGLLDQRISLQGPPGIHHDEVVMTETIMFNTVERAWKEASAAENLLRLIGGHELNSQPVTIDEYFMDAATRLLRQVAVAHYRLTKSPASREALKEQAPQLFEEFCSINGILDLTESDYRQKRHPVIVMSPDDVLDYMQKTTDLGYAPTYQKMLLFKKHPGEALEKAQSNRAKIEATETINGNLGPKVKLAIARKDPVQVIQKRDRLATRLIEQYADDPDVKPSDIKDMLDRHLPENIVNAINDFKTRIKDLTEMYPDDPVIDSHTIRRICRRTLDPHTQVQSIRRRFKELVEAEPDLPINLSLYLARNYSNPQARLQNARRIAESSPQLNPKTPINNIWTILQNQQYTA